MAAYSANDTGILLESGTNELELLETLPRSVK